ncbi:unnamed protein product [Nippostrongylus brasiliensis]|uniref:Secreted protein n=1 Tax=Nippostrongylus brasiliensis TaxID=27835 RepID=A0A0N4YB99_NIPBR|nr:hypothetical protein Q1695_011387 [Nippostrongylus brasiliensis]VDL77311.1 unnamed protein product [Nippostrongylus brasiliensis]
MSTSLWILLACHLALASGAIPLQNIDDCDSLRNTTKSFLDMNTHDRERLENCVYKHLTDMELKFNRDPESFHNDPPPDAKLNIQANP